MKLVAGALAWLFFSLVLSSCNGGKSKTSTEGGVTLGPGTSSGNVQQDAVLVNACNLFSPAEAQQIIGAPVNISPGSRPKNVCMYQEATERPNSMGPGRITLSVNNGNSDAVESKAWARLKEVRHLETGQKNVQAVSGIGDEAWFTGNTVKGKVGVAAVVVKKGKYDFALDSMVLDYVASPEAMKSIARKVAGELK